MTVRPGGLSWSVLLAVHRRRGNAYGVTIREELFERSGRDVSYGAIYTTLARLEADGLLSSHESDPLPERGGRAKRLYEITASGVAALEQATASVKALIENP